MRFRLVAAALLACAALAAEGSGLTIAQLQSFVRSSIKLKHPDKQVAAFLKGIKLKEKLDDRTIEELQGEGAGPRTVEALHLLRDSTVSLAAPVPEAPKPKPIPIPPPSSEEQARVLEATRESALGYSQRLPDFICTQVTRRYADPSGMEFWQTLDTLTARLTYFEQREDYKLILVNNTPTTRSYDTVGGTTSSGEFGTLLHQLFEPRTQARFQWERWATLRGKRAHVFSYQVAQENSQYHIIYEKRLDIITAYRGSVFVDRDTNTVLRITFEATDIPTSFPVQQAGTVLDYDYIDISGKNFLLPLRAVIRMRDGKLLVKNEVEFRRYQKFSADTAITFDTPPPLTEDQTKEQPPK